ncbi:acidic mammalian chitinase-like [Bradysia coprophila]|uniref:acidic mammalian chitinase-like n=1 Tax=Bradysia coprophila TaxID=38358 RepID=UPI00187D95CE|nr:acidic mammalian chitinase-like [Bradysia coprophila]
MQTERSNFKRLRFKNPNVKLMLAIGGWDEGSVTYSNVASSSLKRAVFVTSVYELLNLYGFDGLDFNWQAPGLRGGLYQQDKINFAILLRELKEKFAGAKLLTATVGAAQEYLDLSYDAVQMNELVQKISILFRKIDSICYYSHDLINLYTYEYNGAYDPVTGRFPPAITGLNAPLYAATFDVNKQLNQNASVNAWINAGVSPNKLLLGIPFFGRKYNLTTQNNSRKVPYFYDDYEWISYDDARSVQIKAEYAVSQNLAGVMVWSIEDDDNKNVCGGGAYPLLSTIYKVLSPMK